MMNRSYLLYRRAAAMAEVERLMQRLDTYPTPQTRVALDQLAALVNRIDVKLLAPSS
jgi:hypothetical protein